MARRGLNQKVVFAYNPLPPVDAHEVLERANLPEAQTRKGMDFSVSWQFSGGDEREDVQLKPGDFHPLRETEASQFYRDMYEQGLVVVKTDDPLDSDVKAEARKGLQRALEFHSYRGRRKIVEYRQRQKITTEELEHNRYGDCFWWHINQAKADIISEMLRGPTKKAAQG